MRTRSGGARAPKPASSPATRRELRPRQASRGRGLSAGGTTRRAAGRVTRSSAALSQTNPNNGFASHKRSLSPSPVSGIRRAKRLRRRSTFYGEGSDSEDAADSAYISQDSDVEQKASPRRTRKIPGTGPEKRSPTHAAKGRPDKIAVDKSPVSKESKAGGDNAVIPNWPSLPYMILLDIFRCAAASLSDQERAKWLPAASGVCQAFAEPALTALYQCPPLLTRSMAHGLVSALSKDPTTMTFNYRNKVEELWIDVQEIASKTYRGQHLDFDSLITNLPNLKFIQFFHLKDQPPYRELDASLRWRYPATLFQTLNSGPTKLAGWQWNRRLMGPELDVAGIKAVHQTRSFAGLRKLSLLNYQVPSLHAKESADDAELAAEDHAFVRSIADAIQALPTLEHLAVEASTAINYQLLPLLPKSLVTLELVNCWEVKADDFASYLLSSGYRLQHLILHHNQSLSLAFLTVLGTACPDLRTLSMDFKTFNHHEFYRDSEPNYDDLLTSHQIPVWPENLEKLELKNLKKWTAEGAETLFQSLVDSAPKLLKLRSLDIKAMLNIPYRQRSELRDKWDAKLKQVFLRDKQDPLPFFSLRQPPQQAEASSEAITKRSKKSRRRSATAAAADSPSRRSTRLALQRSLPPSRDSSVGLGRDLRNGLGRPSYVEPDTDTDMDEEDGEGRAGVRESDVFSADSSRSLPATTTGGETLPFRHGMCDKVEFQLDNQKPAEKTYVMEDFLDDEADDLSDDDWTGDDDDLDNGYAW